MVSSERRQNAFSLVEMCIAVGILGFGILAIYGLLPVGLQVSKQARGELRAAEIMTQVTGDFLTWENTTNNALSTPFYGLPTGYNATARKFDSPASGEVVIYQDGATNSGEGEKFIVAATSTPISSGQSARVSLTILRGPAASFSSDRISYTNQESASFASLIIKLPKR